MQNKLYDRDLLTTIQNAIKRSKDCIYRADNLHTAEADLWSMKVKYINYITINAEYLRNLWQYLLQKTILQSLKMLSITKDNKLNKRLSEKKNINNKAVKI